MEWDLGDFTGSKEVEIPNFREWLQTRTELREHEIRSLILRTGRLKWDLIEAATDLGKVNLPKANRSVILSLFELAVINQMPISLLLRTFHPIPQGKLARSRFTALHLIVNSTYPMVEKRLFICKAVRISRTLLTARDAQGRTPISCCKNKRLRGQMTALLSKAGLLWAKFRSNRLIRVPISVIRLIASEYI